MDFDTTIEIDDDYVRDYASHNFNVDDIFTDDEIKRYVASHFQPEDVFDTDELDEWANNNGYIEGE
jgi:hypothetical protein